MAPTHSPLYKTYMRYLSAIFAGIGIILMISGGAAFFLSKVDVNAKNGGIRLFEIGLVIIFFSARSLTNYRAKMGGPPATELGVSDPAAGTTNKRPLPVELNQPFPRNVKASTSFLFTIGLTTVLFFGLTLITIGIPYRFALDQALLKQRGVAAEARVTSLDVVQGKSTSYIVTYQFLPIPNVASDAPLTATRHTAKSTFAALTVGQSVPILYDPTDFTRSDLNFNDVLHTADPYRTMPIMLWIICPMVGGTYFFIMSSMLISYFRDKKLLQYGYAAHATIIDTKLVGGRTSSISATYRFMNQNGKPVQGTQANLPTEAQRKSERFKLYWDNIMTNPIAIYDPDNNEESILYGAGNVQCDLP